MTDKCTVSCAATLGNVQLLTDTVRNWIEAEGLGKVLAADLELAVAEAANNIVLHGTHGMEGQIMAVTICRVPGGVQIVLADKGHAIPAGMLDTAIPFDPGAESGRGMGLIAACTDRVDYTATSRGNRLVLFKSVQAAATDPETTDRTAR